MSELKAYIAQISELNPAPCQTVYLKSEADAVLAEKDKVIAELEDKLKVQTSIAEEGWKSKDTYHSSYAEAVKELYEKNKELRHQKYKRCVAMAMWCDDAARLATWDADYHRCGWYNKWRKRWLAIAEKFKEAK